jgi:regulator of sigma E protease
MSIVILIVGILLFISLVVVHEFGHFIMARRNGVEVEEFGIFFPPRLFSHRTKGGWLFTINLLPLGGFVKLKGEHDVDTARGSFGAATLLAKSKIMIAGVVMNLIVAFALLTFLSLVGIPKLIDNQFTYKGNTKTHTYMTNAANLVTAVQPGSPAQKAGIKNGDQLIAIGPVGAPKKITNPALLSSITKADAGRAVTISLERDKKTLNVIANLRTKAAVSKLPTPSYLGVATSGEYGEITIQKSTWAAPLVAAGLIKQFTVLTYQGLETAVKGLGSFFSGATTGNTLARQHGLKAASGEVGGPVAIFLVLKDGSSSGWSFMLLIIAIISLTLAIMNILPIPALDGGKFWITLIAHAIHRPLSPKREEIINAAGFALLLTLIVLVTINDIINIHRF